VQDLIAVYRELASCCDYALHLGLTEAGMGSKGIVASTAAMAAATRFLEDNGRGGSCSSVSDRCRVLMPSSWALPSSRTVPSCFTLKVKTFRPVSVDRIVPGAEDRVNLADVTHPSTPRCTLADAASWSEASAEYRLFSLACEIRSSGWKCDITIILSFGHQCRCPWARCRRQPCSTGRRWRTLPRPRRAA